MISYEALERSEPALLFGGLTGGGGFLALLAANFSAGHSAGLAAGMATLQALLTRPTVVSQESVDKILAPEDTPGTLAGVISAAATTPHPDEPAMAIGALIFLLGFLVQLFAGVDMTTAFASAAGLAGAQALLTRSRVHSPANAQAIAAKVVAPRLGKAAS